MTNRRRLIEGDFVTINLPVDDVRVTDGMKMYDGVKTTVSKVKKVMHYNFIDPKALKMFGKEKLEDLGYEVLDEETIIDPRKKQSSYIYELSGIKSMKGVPYTFMRDMLYASRKEN